MKLFVFLQSQLEKHELQDALHRPETVSQMQVQHAWLLRVHQ